MRSSRLLERLVRAALGRRPGATDRATTDRPALDDRRRSGTSAPDEHSSTATPRGGSAASRTRTASDYPGDFSGPVRAVYAPDLDGDADPGEVVWTWVPYEEDHARGKDRPVLVVGHDGPWLLALMLSTRDHDGPAARRDERWLDLGAGTWDARGRPSEVRLDRVLRLRPDAVRREGAVLDRTRFELVVRALS